MALSDLKSMKNKWALHTWDDHALFVKLGDTDRLDRRIRIRETYQTDLVNEIKTIDIGSEFDSEAIVCRKNISGWLKIFYPSLRKVS